MSVILTIKPIKPLKSGFRPPDRSDPKFGFTIKFWHEKGKLVPSHPLTENGVQKFISIFYHWKQLIRISILSMSYVTTIIKSKPLEYSTSYCSLHTRFPTLATANKVTLRDFYFARFICIQYRQVKLSEFSILNQDRQNFSTSLVSGEPVSTIAFLVRTHVCGWWLSEKRHNWRKAGHIVTCGW